MNFLRFRRAARQRPKPVEMVFADVVLNQAPELRIRNTELYQRASPLTDGRPFACSDRLDGFGFCDEFPPGVAGSLDDVVVGFEDAVRKPVRAYVLPDVLDRV